MDEMHNKRNPYKSMRDHDYLFDGTYTVSGEKDHRKMIKKAAIATAEMSIAPIYEHMFSDLKLYPSTEKVFIPNAHLPNHLDLSYSGRLYPQHRQSASIIIGKDRFKYFTTPKPLTIATTPAETIPEVMKIQPSIQMSPKGYLVDKSVQTIFRDSTIQTDPYQPDYIIREGCKEIPEVLLLDQINIGVDDVKRGIDVSIVQWVNRQRAKRAWLEFKPTCSILAQLEYNEQRQREAEIDNILLKQMEESDYISEIYLKTDVRKPRRLWMRGTENLERNIEKIQKCKERGSLKFGVKYLDIRKLKAKQLSRSLKMENGVSWPPFVIPKAPFVMINTDFLPSFEQLQNKSILFEKDVCTKNVRRKKSPTLEFHNILKDQKHNVVKDDSRMLSISEISEDSPLEDKIVL